MSEFMNLWNKSINNRKRLRINKPLKGKVKKSEKIINFMHASGPINITGSL